jgi:serine phosphatase RsbU (regulator of sigma subunit)
VSAAGARSARQNEAVLRVLVIFESRAVRETVAVLDVREGVEVRSADTYEAGLKAVGEVIPDAVLVSAVAGQQRARELIPKIKNLPNGVHIPVGMVAVRFGAGERDQACRAGADVCLELTGDDEDLLMRVMSLARMGMRGQTMLREKQAAEERSLSLARANAEAGRLILDVEERDRRIREQQRELAEHNRKLARANAEAGRLIMEIEEKDRRLEGQSSEIERHLTALRRDLAIAADLQINLLPVEYPNAPELRLYDRFLPANELCGDYYDYILHPDGDFDVVVADVTGHGVASALVSVQIRAIARARGPFEKSPARTIKHLNDFMVANFHRQFLMTMFYLGYRAAGRARPRIVYAGAGHTPPLLLRAAGGAIQELRSQGLPLGVDGASPYAEGEIELLPGDRLLIHTDGLIEVYDGSRRQWGLDGLKHALIASADLAGREVIDKMLREARYFSGQRPFDDDVTVVLVERAGSGREAARHG